MAKNQLGSSPQETRFTEELSYLYKRLETVENLIRTIENYDRLRPKMIPLRPRQKTA